jgi:hypothetical protein
MGEIGLVTLAPLLPLFGLNADKLLIVFKKRENIKKLLKLITSELN